MTLTTKGQALWQKAFARSTRGPKSGVTGRDRRPFLDESQLRAVLAVATIIDANTASNIPTRIWAPGLVIEAIAGQPCGAWIKRMIGLMARRHCGDLPIWRRVAVPGGNPTNALAPATSFVSTAGDRRVADNARTASSLRRRPKVNW